MPGLSTPSHAGPTTRYRPVSPSQNPSAQEQGQQSRLRAVLITAATAVAGGALAYAVASVVADSDNFDRSDTYQPNQYNLVAGAAALAAVPFLVACGSSVVRALRERRAAVAANAASPVQPDLEQGQPKGPRGHELRGLKESAEIVKARKENAEAAVAVAEPDAEDNAAREPVLLHPLPMK